MSASPRKDAQGDIPEDPPGPAEGGRAAMPEQPLGVPGEQPAGDDESPGLPEQEPPTSG